jgi:glycine/D-amino acid oxidase-like deaminating enzyme
LTAAAQLHLSQELERRLGRGTLEGSENMSNGVLPHEVDAVVIGSGALGASTAFHLAKAGLKIALVDKAALASQTSPRAAGLSGQLRSDDRMTMIAARAVKKIETFSEDTGEPLLFYQPGSLKVARRLEHAAQIHEEVARGQALGLPVNLLTPEQARGLMPFLHAEGVKAVMHMRSDVYLEPEQIPLAYAAAAGKLSAALLPNTEVQEIQTTGGRVFGVRTNRGEIRAPVVVDAAGAWLRAVAALGGSTVKLVPTRHQLMITVPLPEVRPEQPITRIIDANVYVRPCKGGLMLGGYEADPVQYDMGTMPEDFSIDQLALDLGVLRRLAEGVAVQLPVFKDVALQEYRGGLPTMTADGEHVIGAAPGVSGLFVIGGCCVGGLSTAPALGELLSELIVAGKPSMDISMMDPARAAISLPEEALKQLCRLQYAHHYWAPETMPATVN